MHAKSSLRAIISTALATMLIGCVSDRVVVHKPEPIEISRLPKVSARGPVAIVSTRIPNAPVVELCSALSENPLSLLWHKKTVTLDDITDASARGLESALRRMDVTVSPTAEKTINVQATEAGCELRGAMLMHEYSVALKVQTGDNAVFRATSAVRNFDKGLRVDETLPYLINEDILKVMNDPAMRSYLER